MLVHFFTNILREEKLGFTAVVLLAPEVSTLLRWLGAIDWLGEKNNFLDVKTSGNLLERGGGWLIYQNQFKKLKFTFE